MQLLEEYKELIERDAADISYLWKLVQTFLYLLCAISGYVCSILFYLIWQQIFNGNCPLWAKSVTMLELELDDTVNKYIRNSNYTDWWNYVITSYEYRNKCTIYIMTCFSSCIFGTIWLILFFICGKGGYGIAMQIQAPWRIIPFAMFFNFIFAIITTYVTVDLEKGYEEFTKDVKNVFLKISNIYEIPKNISECEIVHRYVDMYNFEGHNMCNMLVWLQAFSGIMMWSWIGGLLVLIFRIIIINDFRILQIRIYEVPNNFALNKTENNQTEMHNKNQNEKTE